MVGSVSKRLKDSVRSGRTQCISVTSVVSGQSDLARVGSIPQGPEERQIDDGIGNCR
jgi:hypothetical protein